MQILLLFTLSSRKMCHHIFQRYHLAIEKHENQEENKINFEPHYKNYRKYNNSN